MSERHARSALNGALSQRDRIVHAPAPRRVEVDGRSLAQLLGFGADYGALIRFYDLHNLPDGDWSLFFQADRSVALALCAALDLPDIEIELDRLVQALRQAAEPRRRHAPWSILAKLLMRLARLIEPGELADLDRDLDLDRALAVLMAAGRIVALAEPARRLVRHLAGEAPAVRLAREHIGSIWLDELVALLDELVAGLIMALTTVRNQAAAALEESFHDQLHAPQAGLWDAFAKLFQHAQNNVNRFPRRLLRFYHDAVLRQDARAARADRLVLAFTPTPGAGPVRLDEGTAFTSGADSGGASIVYALDAAVTVDAASVTALHTLTVATAPIGSDSDGSDGGGDGGDSGGDNPARPAQLLSGVVQLSADAPTIASPFPLFGANAPGVDGALLSTTASLGFALASPCFLLAGGTRTVTLSLGIPAAQVDSLARQYGTPGGSNDSNGSDGSDGSDGADHTDDDDDAWPATLAQLLAQAFALSYSSADGTSAIATYDVTAPTAADGPYVLSFQLDPDAAAWTAAPAFDAGPAVPVLYARLMQAATTLEPGGVQVYPYTLLSQLDLSGIGITVRVDGLTQLQIAGPSGPVDSSQAFTVFGSPPVQYAALSLGATELFVKQLDDFSMNIDWFGLPVTSTGFQGYYEAYTINADGETVAPGSLFDNDCFTVTMDVVNPGLWNFSPTPTPQKLFRSEPDATLSQPPLPTPPLPTTLLDQPAQSQAAGEYYDPAMSYVRLRLETPDYAFGDILYAPNVMAASIQLTAAASACAVQCAQQGWGGAAAGLLDPVAAAGTGASERHLAGAIAAAVQQAVAGLDGAALNAVDSAIDASGADAEQQQAWRADLAAALRQPRSRSLLQKLRSPGRANPDYATVHANAVQWLGAHASALAAGAPALSAKAQALLDAGDALLATQAEAAGAPPALARPVTAAGVGAAQTDLRDADQRSSDQCVGACLDDAGTTGLPNQPWLPMAKSISAGYGARAALPATAPTDHADSRFFHLQPFDRIEAVAWPAGASVPLLAPVEQAGSLLIDLSAPPQSLSLLFQLAPPASGWPTDTPSPTWWQATGPGSWRALLPQNDGTNGMRQSGIVHLTLGDWAADAPLRLRLSLAAGDAALFPLLAGLSSNVADATWQGPGGAAELDRPLTPGTAIKPLVPLPGIAAVTLPLASSGGLARASGAAFDLWLAERLRHKDYGIQAWDYASLVLAAFPTLWQVAVVPVSDGGPGRAPGHVWVVPVPGPHTPAIADPTIPSNDGQTLGEIAAYLAARISPFIELNVTNPPYLRLTVHAELLFTDDDAVQACITRLNAELIDFLSPWPPAGLEARPSNYYTRQEVASFVRQRPYVRGILSLSLSEDRAGCTASRPYYTSAMVHAVSGKAVPAAERPRRPNLSLPDGAARGAAT